jgi:hypothetical protein
LEDYENYPGYCDEYLLYWHLERSTLRAIICKDHGGVGYGCSRETSRSRDGEALWYLYNSATTWNLLLWSGGGRRNGDSRQHKTASPLWDERR